MKNSKLFLVFGLVYMVSVGYGQEYAFKVLANKGQNEVMSGGSWQVIKTGASLQAADQIKLVENAYLGLIYKTGRPLEIRQAGSYKVADLAAQVKEGASVLNKYTDFILSSNSAEAQKNRLSATGAVTRGTTGDIALALPANEFSSILNNHVVINWESKVSGPYVVKLLNMFDDVLLSTETPENRLEIDLTNPALANESAILVEVHSKVDPTAKSADPRPMIKRLSTSDRDRLMKEVTDAKSQLSDETAMGMFYLGQIFEQNKLYHDAIYSYEQAIKMAPDVDDYKASYKEFIEFRLPHK